jgi:hypothetical protein
MLQARQPSPEHAELRASPAELGHIDTLHERLVDARLALEAYKQSLGLTQCAHGALAFPNEAAAAEEDEEDAGARLAGGLRECIDALCLSAEHLKPFRNYPHLQEPAEQARTLLLALRARAEWVESRARGWHDGGHPLLCEHVPIRLADGSWANGRLELWRPPTRPRAARGESVSVCSDRFGSLSMATWQSSS